MLTAQQVQSLQGASGVMTHQRMPTGTAAAAPVAKNLGRDGGFGYTSKANPIAMQGINAVAQTTKDQSAWANDFLFPQMEKQIQQQGVREDQVWKTGVEQYNHLNRQATNMQNAGNRVGTQQEAGMNGLMQSAQRQANISDAEYGRYSRTGGAALDSMTKEAMAYDSPAQAERMAGSARGDVATAFATQRSEAMRQQQAYGINPNSGAGQAAMSGLQVNEAAARAAAGNKARIAADQLGWQKRGDVAQLGGQVMSASQNAAQLSGSLRSQAADVGTSAVNSRGAGAQLRQAGSQALNTGYAVGQTGVANMQAFGQTGAQQFGQTLDGYNSIAGLGNQEYGIRSGVSTANANRKSQESQSEAAGWGQALGTAVGIGAMFLSDRRLKENIVRVGALPSGLPLYQFNYVDLPDYTVTGVMADEAEQLFPEAVTTGEDGFKRVNYDLVR